MDVAIRQGMQLIVTIVLARLLAPEDFGLIAMLALFVGVAGTFIDGGLSSALIQRQNSSHTDESSIFYFNLGMGATAALLLCLGASWIAGFFGSPELEGLTYAMAATLFINSLGSIHITLLTRGLDFRTLAKIGALASLLSGGLAIMLALGGYGVWSLGVQAMAASAVNVALLWRWSHWRPAWTYRHESLMSYFRFGGYEMAANLTDAISTNLNAILIGKLFSVREAGFYDRAQRTQQLPINMMTNIINRVAFSVFSRSSGDSEKLARGLKRSQLVSMAINLPVMTCLIVLAEPLVSTLFGVRWAPAAPILQVLAIAGLIWPLHVMNLSVLKAQGKADVFFWITVLKKTVTIGLTLAASLVGVLAIAWAQVAASLFAYLVNAHYSKRLLGYGACAQLRDLSLLFAAAIPAALVMQWVKIGLDAAPEIELLSAIAAGAAVYWLACWIICRETMNELLALARGRARTGQ